MFTTKETNDEPEQNKTQESNTILQSVKYKSILQKDEDKTQSNEIQYSNIDSILELRKILSKEYV